MCFEKICSIISTQLGVKLEDITQETSLTEDLGADSLDIFQILYSVQLFFSVELTDEEISGVKTVDDILRLIELRV